MTIYDVLFDMSSVPKKVLDAQQSPAAGQFVNYISRSIELSAIAYMREYNRIHDHEKSFDFEMGVMFEKEFDDSVVMMERTENMVTIMKEVAQLKKAEQEVFVCLYQLDWSVSKTARAMRCSESYVCRSNRSIIRKLGLVLRGSE